MLLSLWEGYDRCKVDALALKEIGRVIPLTRKLKKWAFETIEKIANGKKSIGCCELHKISQVRI